MIRILAIAVAVLLIGFVGVVGFRRYQQDAIPQANNKQTSTDCANTVTIREHTICVEIRDTDAERQRGLSGRDPLREKHGMLFLFPLPGKYTFWMKEMKFALDFLWIRDSRVVDITQNVPPPEAGTPLNQLKVYGPAQEVDQVLELNAGTITSLGIATGDAVMRK